MMEWKAATTHEEIYELLLDELAWHERHFKAVNGVDAEKMHQEIGAINEIRTILLNMGYEVE